MTTTTDDKGQEKKPSAPASRERKNKMRVYPDGKDFLIEVAQKEGSNWEHSERFENAALATKYVKDHAAEFANCQVRILRVYEIFDVEVPDQPQVMVKTRKKTAIPR